MHRWDFNSLSIIFYCWCLIWLVNGIIFSCRCCNIHTLSWFCCIVKVTNWVWLLMLFWLVRLCKMYVSYGWLTYWTCYFVIELWTQILIRWIFNNVIVMLNREIESARLLDGNSLPEKIWLKVFFLLCFWFAVSWYDDCFKLKKSYACRFLSF